MSWKIGRSNPDGNENVKKNKETWPGAVRLKIIILRAVIQSWNFADFDLYIGGETGKLRNLGFRQSPIPLSLVVGIAFAVLSDVPSASAVSC